MEDCKAQKRARKCNSNENSCQQEIRTWGPGGMYKSISQKCKQKHACQNNKIQNPRAAWKHSQCQPIRHPENSVCRCCCSGWDYCNGKEYAGCPGAKYMEEAAATTLSPATTEDPFGINGIEGSDIYGNMESGKGAIGTGESGSFNLLGMIGEGGEDGEEATTTPAPVVEDSNSGGSMTAESTGDSFGIGMLQTQGQAPTCGWGDWTEWDKCSETCGGGQRNRYRNPIGGTIGDPGCEGFGEEVSSGIVVIKFYF